MYPEGFRHLLVWIKNQYDNVPVFITENGIADSGDLIDATRESFHKVIYQSTYTYVIVQFTMSTNI